MLAAGAAALAQAGEAPKVDTGDTAWMLISTALVMLMTPGLALFYGGMVRSKNVLNTLMQSFVAVCAVTVIWVVCGYSLAFAPGNAFVGGLSWLGLTGVGQEPSGYGTTIPHQVFMVYQMMFAVITPALISGAIADRMRFGAYLAFIALWSVIVYSPLAHMVWGEGGFLRELGALDFAGGTVVHISSGFSALVLAVMLGKRRYGATEDLRPHSLPMTLIGTALLWFGWFGFNAGSAIGAGGLAGSAFVVTHIAAAVAGLTWVAIEWIAYHKPTALGLATGAVAGLVAITPASGFVGPMAAIAIGAGVSVLSFFAIKLKARLGYDDTLDVFGVHGMGGTWGALATGLFASRAVNAAGADGLFAGGGFGLLGKQIIGVLMAIACAVVGTLLIGFVLKATIGLRVSAEEEEAGLDLTQHGESGYAGPSTGSETPPQSHASIVPVGTIQEGGAPW
ncbi:MAG: ammonium transporter [Chthonomonadales bacterium]|nr:ammonium transporter [Chthonomonadales bacterium]